MLLVVVLPLKSNSLIENSGLCFKCKVLYEIEMVLTKSTANSLPLDNQNPVEYSEARGTKPHWWKGISVVLF